ncbi:MAG UNVERIFIED_CONTAM: hypothetical protein LVT10_19990 [Anaerolineae bacterium]|jgi:phosphopantothenoylcysteine synthetase/decarboxylase
MISADRHGACHPLPVVDRRRRWMGRCIPTATRANLQTLIERGVYVIEPEEGRFASGLVGKGRLPDTPF